MTADTSVWSLLAQDGGVILVDQTISNGHIERMKTVNVNEAKTHLSKLLERVRAGEEICIAKSGKPIARLVPLATPGERKPGLLQGTVEDSFFEPLPEEELEAWES